MGQIYLDLFVFDKTVSTPPQKKKKRKKETNKKQQTQEITA